MTGVTRAACSRRGKRPTRVGPGGVNGEEAILPVPRDTRHWFASPQAVGYLVRAAEVPSDRLAVRSLTMPGVSATVADEIEALRRADGDDAVGLIRKQPDPAIHAIVSTWPKAFDAGRARELGFVPDRSFEEIVEIYQRNELGKRRSVETN